MARPGTERPFHEPAVSAPELLGGSTISDADLDRRADLAGIVIVLTAMKMTSSIIAPMLLAFFLMMIFRPLMAALEQRRVPRAFVDSQPQHRWVRALFASGPPLGTTLQKQRPVPVIEHEPPASDEAPSSVAP